MVGFLYVTIENDAPIYLHDDFALVREWLVEPAFRGRGAGESLLARAAADFTGSGVQQLRVRARVAGAEERQPGWRSTKHRIQAEHPTLRETIEF